MSENTKTASEFMDVILKISSNMPNTDRYDVFERMNVIDIIRKYDNPDDIINKYYEWERKTEEDNKIHVGDEVIIDGRYEWVTYVDDACTHTILYDGRTYKYCNDAMYKHIKKTGRHNDDIEKLLDILCILL